MAIARAPVPALACIAGITGKGGNGKDVVVLAAILVGGGSKPIIISLHFLILVLP
jgi:hypothetical protein